MPRRARAVMTRAEQVAYLNAESLQLAEKHRYLIAEGTRLGTINASRDEQATFRIRLFEHRCRLRNHRLALEWLRHPPCGRFAPDSDRPCDNSQFLTAT